MLRLLLILITAASLWSCGTGSGTRRTGELAKALDKAGKNRSELEEVLDHYADEPEKLAAAEWLITNMPGHYSYEGPQLDSMEKVLAPLASYAVNFKIDTADMARWNHMSFADFERIDHVRAIRSEYLIDNIDQAYSDWKEKPWNKNLPFEAFCELLLPYCIGDEPISSWRKLYRETFQARFDSLYSGNDAVEAARTLGQLVAEIGWKYNDELIMPHRRADRILTSRVGYNRDIMDRYIYAMRALGIPAAVDMLIISPQSSMMHQWVVVRDNITGRHIPFGCDDMVPDRVNPPRDKRKKGKVYRGTYAKQEDRMSKIDDIRSLTVRLVNPYIKDVSQEYFQPVEVTVPVSGVSPHDKVYLTLPGVDKDWRPVDIGQRKGDSVVFRNFECGVFFVPASVRGPGFQPCGEAFYVDASGNLRTLKADTTCVRKVRVSRVRPMQNPQIVNITKDIIGGVFTAYRDLSSSSAPDTLLVITDTVRERRSKFLLDGSGSYAKIRYTPPKGRNVILAELELYADQDATEPVPFSVMGTFAPRVEPQCLSDGDLNTSFTIPGPDPFFEIQLRPVSPVRSMRLTPRNDDKFVKSAHRYRLEYFAGARNWRSVGEGSPEEGVDFMDFVVPGNSLMRILDLNNGDGGQIFIFENDRQKYAINLGFYHLLP